MTKPLGPGPIHRSETTSSAGPVAASPGGHFGARSYASPLAGLATFVVVGAIVALAIGLFQGSFTKTVPVTVVSPRAGLVMNPEAKVKMRGVQVGKVASIESLSNGEAALHLAMDPSQLRFIPANVRVDITSSTVFGAKFVDLVPPAEPSAQRLRAGQTLDGKHVTVEINTVFQQLTSLLSKIEPEKLNETLGALGSAFNGRGAKLGQALSDFDAFLAKIDPSRPALRHDIATAPTVLNAYADAAPDLVRAADSATQISRTIVEEQNNLDALLISSIGLADIGNQVLGDNRQRLSDVVHLLLPTTDLTNQYHAALTCGIKGLSVWNQQPLQKDPGITLLTGFEFGAERYRYPHDLPRVAAKGGPQCTDLPHIPFEGHAPSIVADTGSNPFEYNNQYLLWNSDLIKEWLFGPLDGPPRNTAQIGQPG
ncbi:MCE-family protein [Mycobacterium avium subsp. hominissuis]|nr:MCE family protein [Mycobacterium avium]APA74597.1 MCE family protein [Mycobacterium avium subsp. hominissuis]ATO61563.2 MCE family protein [Mycobacterium avium subsp. hominissuis]ATO66114.1 MCE family protein [Mycobacterium avium subsp. hominissuis]ATO70700.2 MCE family protein [Mycobacterium avium subsp. hominissuis]PBJ41760.1 MCE-family protein [Mycobacterium avium subsp. hominissuis]